MNRSSELGRSTHLAQRVVGGLALVALSLILALAGCDTAQESRPVDKPMVDVDAPGVDVEINKPHDADAEN